MITMDMDMILNMTMLTTYDNWEATWVTLYYFFRETAQESYYGYVLQMLLPYLVVSKLIEVDFL